jgi:hypothetical protein
VRFLSIPDSDSEGVLSSPTYNDQLVIDTSLNVSELDQKREESDNSETDVEREWSGTSRTNTKRPQGDSKTAKKVRRECMVLYAVCAIFH